MILAIVPTAKGFAYAIVSKQKEVVTIGRANLSRFGIEYMMKRIRHVIHCYSARVIVIPRYESNKHSARGELLMNATESYAIENAIESRRYDYDQVKTAFGIYKAETRFEMAVALTKVYPELKPKLPKPRKSYMNEPYTAPMFSALALALTHLYLSE